MRKYVMPILAVAVLGLATPATAYEAGDLISMHAALQVATGLGVTTVSHTQFLGDEWEIEGRDMSGRYIEVYVDANTGDVLWQTTVGVAERLPAGKQNTGLAGGFAGPTATSGGLLFYGALADRKLRAFDSTTGKELWSVDLGATATMQPMSYLGSDARQYVAVVAGGVVKTFALPR